ncbi:yippee-like protein, partial [Tanacetum coccineum]
SGYASIVATTNPKFISQFSSQTIQQPKYKLLGSSCQETTHDKLQKYKEGKPVLERFKLYGPDGNSYWVRHEAHIGGTDEDDCTQSQLPMKYENGQGNDPPLCENNDDPDAIWNNVVTEVESGDNVGGGSKTKVHDGGSGAVAMDEGQGVDKGVSVNEYLVKTLRPEDEVCVHVISMVSFKLRFKKSSPKLLCTYKDVTVDAATGSGKTLAFVVPLGGRRHGCALEIVLEILLATEIDNHSLLSFSSYSTGVREADFEVGSWLHF